MSILVVEPACWPPRPGLRARRWRERLTAGITEELDALADGHRLLVALLDRLDHDHVDDLAEAVEEIVSAIVTPLDMVALIETARPLPDAQRLLRHALAQGAQAASRLRRLAAPPPFGLPPSFEHARAVLSRAEVEISDAGRALATADRTVVSGQTPTTEVPS